MKTTFYAVLAAAVALSNGLTASFPEVIPGPGLPSLEELGLTSKDLYTKPMTMLEAPASDKEAREVLGADYTDVCQTYTTGNVDNVIACFNYLVNIGNVGCGVNGDNVQFCYAGDAQVTGSNISGTSSASSSCYDVALGLQWIFTYCNVGGRVGGSAAAYGNGWLIVGVENIIW